MCVDMFLVEVGSKGFSSTNGVPMVVHASVESGRNFAEILEPSEYNSIVIRLHSDISDWVAVTGPVRQLGKRVYQAISKQYAQVKWAFVEAGLPELLPDPNSSLLSNWEIITQYRARTPELLQLLKRLAGCETTEEKRTMLMRLMSEENAD